MAVVYLTAQSATAGWRVNSPTPSRVIEFGHLLRAPDASRARRWSHALFSPLLAGLLGDLLGFLKD